MAESTSREKKSEPESEATSKELLSDVEENEADNGPGSELDPGPSPDGAFDQSNENKDAGPL